MTGDVDVCMVLEVGICIKSMLYGVAPGLFGVSIRGDGLGAS